MNELNSRYNCFQINNLSGEPIEIFWVNTVDFDIISDDALMKLSTEPVEDGEAVGVSCNLHRYICHTESNLPFRYLVLQLFRTQILGSFRSESG